MKAGTGNLKNGAGKKEVWHPGKRDGKVLKEEVVRNGAEDTTNMRGINFFPHASRQLEEQRAS